MLGGLCPPLPEPCLGPSSFPQLPQGDCAIFKIFLIIVKFKFIDVTNIIEDSYLKQNYKGKWTQNQ